MPNNNGQFDTDIEIVTPENIAFRYRVAGPFRRLPAYLIDLMIRIMIAVAGLVMFSILAAILGFVIGNVMFGMGMMLTLVLWFLLAWFYGGFLETYYNGQTPGKRLMQIRVISVDGQPINGLQAVLRNVLRTVDAQPAMLYLAGLVTATRNSRFQRLGDLACGTMVVVEQPHWMQGLVRLGTPEVQRMAAAIPPSFQASRSLARALAAYVHRRQNFSVLRRLEIARHVGVPLRDKLRLPPQTNLDLLLCALYQRTFVTDREDEPAAAGSPFAVARSPVRQSSSPFAQAVKPDDIADVMERMDG